VERRKATRFKIDSPARLRAHGRTDVVSAYDLSRDGCLLQAAQSSLSVGHRVSVVFRGHRPIEGTIIWTKHRNAGVQFLEPLSWPRVQCLIDEACRGAADEHCHFDGADPSGPTLVVATRSLAGAVLSPMTLRFASAALVLCTAILLVAA
jgi:hypothetical protein